MIQYFIKLGVIGRKNTGISLLTSATNKTANYNFLTTVLWKTIIVTNTSNLVLEASYRNFLPSSQWVLSLILGNFKFIPTEFR